MKADDVQVTISCETMAEIVTRGKLIGPQGRELADFRQTFRIWRGVRVLYLDVELNPRHEPKTDPWNSYYACRFAWSDESAQLAGAILQTRQTFRVRRFESPLYVDIDDAVRRTTILTGGLPFHRRHQFNMLDTLLIVRGESARRFQLGIGVDLKNPLHDALALITPPTSLAVDAPAPAAGASSWLFHIDHRSVIATHWSPLTEADQVVGFRVRLLETQGRPARGKLSSFRPARSAQVVDFLDQTLADCRIDEGAVHFELSAHEWLELKVRTSG
jgi:alpha-mannosidase